MTRATRKNQGLTLSLRHFSLYLKNHVRFHPHLPACSCCGKPGNKVDKLIQIAEDFYICNNCVEICVNMIVKDTGLPMATRFIRGILNMEPSAYAMCQAEARKAAAADMLRETAAGPASYEGPLPTPEEMCATLNQYVIGQDYAKKCFP